MNTSNSLKNVKKTKADFNETIVMQEKIHDKNSKCHFFKQNYQWVWENACMYSLWRVINKEIKKLFTKHQPDINV